MRREIRTTADGSNTLYLPEMEEQYHSKHGALIESQHIFVENGLLAFQQHKKIRVFEVGMGTGLNILTSFTAGLEDQLNVEYETIEAYPLTSIEIKAMNFVEQLKISESVFSLIHDSAWEENITLSNQFILTKYHRKLDDFEVENNKFDVIYFDAFAPEKQPKMWTEEVFRKMFRFLITNGCLVTYCVKGEIRRKLKAVGFEVEKLKGPKGGKREMCRAWKRA